MSLANAITVRKLKKQISNMTDSIDMNGAIISAELQAARYEMAVNAKQSHSDNMALAAGLAQSNSELARIAELLTKTPDEEWIEEQKNFDYICENGTIPMLKKERSKFLNDYESYHIGLANFAYQKALEGIDNVDYSLANELMYQRFVFLDDSELIGSIGNEKEETLDEFIYTLDYLLVKINKLDKSIEKQEKLLSKTPGAVKKVEETKSIKNGKINLPTNDSAEKILNDYKKTVDERNKKRAIETAKREQKENTQSMLLSPLGIDLNQNIHVVLGRAKIISGKGNKGDYEIVISRPSYGEICVGQTVLLRFKKENITLKVKKVFKETGKETDKAKSDSSFESYKLILSGHITSKKDVLSSYYEKLKIKEKFDGEAIAFSEMTAKHYLNTHNDSVKDLQIID